MKKRKLWLIIAPLAIIAICVSLMAGSTFALFTSQSEVGITVSAGKVDVATTVTAEKVQSPADVTYDKETGEASAEGLTDSAHATAAVVGNELTVSKMLPGDEVTFNIEIVNNGDNANVQYSLECMEGFELMNEFEISGLGLGVSTFKKYTCNWFVLNKGETVTVTVTLKLPLEAEKGNGTEAKIVVNVFAIQENVTVVGGEELVAID